MMVKQDTMETDLNKLIEEVTEWWEEHEYDKVQNLNEYYNVYESEPDFVTTAKRIKKEQEEDQD